MEFLEGNIKPPLWISGKSVVRDVILFGEAKVIRNLADEPFPVNLQKEDRKRITRVLLEAVGDKFEYRFSAADYELEDRFLISERMHLPPYAARKPIPCEVLFNRDERLTVLINCSDHIRATARSAVPVWEQLASQANAVVDGLSGNFTWAYHGTFGYLTQNPLEAGAGVSFGAVCHIAGVILDGSVGKLVDDLRALGVRVRLFNPDVLSNAERGYLMRIDTFRLAGRSAPEVLDDIVAAAELVVEREREARKRLMLRLGLAFADRVRRAFGTIATAEMLTETELFSTLMVYRLGVAVGVVEGSLERIDEALLTGRDAHILKIFEEKVDSRRDIDYYRARYVRGLLGLAGSV